MVEISPNELKDIIVEMYLKGNRDSMLFIGDAGIGKSVAVYEASMKLAELLGKEFVVYDDLVAEDILREPERYFVMVDFRLTEVEPSDLLGIPREFTNKYFNTNEFVGKFKCFINKVVGKRVFKVPELDFDVVIYKPLLWAMVLKKTKGILFLDEITNVQRPDVQSAMYKIILERRVGFIKFNDDVLVVSAGNSPEHSSIAGYLPAPFINRVKVFKIKSPTVEEWIDWMNWKYGDTWDKDVGVFLIRFPQYFNMKQQDVELLEQFAKPRTWTKLALTIKDIDDVDRINIYAESLIGREPTPPFITFKKYNPPDLDYLNEHPEEFSKLQVGEKYILISEIAGRVMTDYNSIKKLLLHLAECDNELIMPMLILIPSDIRIQVLRKFMEDEDLKVVYEIIERSTSDEFDDDEQEGDGDERSGEDGNKAQKDN